MIAVLITLIVTIPISILWVNGISNMKKNHPDYKGDDFLGEIFDRKKED